MKKKLIPLIIIFSLITGYFIYPLITKQIKYKYPKNITSPEQTVKYYFRCLNLHNPAKANTVIYKTYDNIQALEWYDTLNLAFIKIQNIDFDEHNPSENSTKNSTSYLITFNTYNIIPNYEDYTPFLSEETTIYINLIKDKNDHWLISSIGF